jgi:hypothetical protein
VAFQGGCDSRREGNLVYRRNWDIHRGAQVTAATGFNGGLDEAMHQRYRPQTWWCDRVNAIYIHKFLELAAARAIPVVWLLPPIAPEAQARRDQTGVDAKQTRFVAATLARHRNLIVLDGRRSGYGPSAFADPVHLNGRGARVLSADLALLLAHADQLVTSQTRWLALPPYRDRAIGDRLEELDQVALTARFEEARRRR